jgi:hypothetical protein
MGTLGTPEQVRIWKVVMESNKFTFNGIARVYRKNKRGMFGLVLELPKSLADFTGFRFWVVYGNSCFYCAAFDDVDKVCQEHGWYVRLFDGTEGC